MNDWNKMNDITLVGAVTSPTGSSGDVDPNGDLVDVLLDRLQAHTVVGPSLDAGEHALAVRRMILAGEALSW